jgi:hypothetical protein
MKMSYNYSANISKGSFSKQIPIINLNSHNNWGRLPNGELKVDFVELKVLGKNYDKLRGFVSKIIIKGDSLQ